MKDTFKSVILRSKLLNVASFFSSNAVILRYHSVKEVPVSYKEQIGLSIIHSRQAFEEQMEFIARYANIVTMDEIGEAIAKKKKLPNRSVAVTFDDGFKDNLNIARPIMNLFGIKATIYITVDCIQNNKAPWFSRIRHSFFNTTKKEWQNGRSKKYNLDVPRETKTAILKACEQCAVLSGDEQEEYIQSVENELEVPGLKNKELMMDFNDLKVLQDEGHIIGSHTISHPNISFLSEEAIKYELGKSKRILEEELGTEVVHFSYPNPALYPNWSDKSTAICKEIGYKTAVLSESGSVKVTDNPLLLKRMWVPEDFDAFNWYLQMTFTGKAL
jgi:peptidoglycan/xylan/chitin deacetylase (PgdA/CDA1 family)